MIEPKDLSHSDLKGMHKMAREKYKCANSLISKGEASILLSMIDEELEKRGYDVTLLFKGYDPNERKDK